VTIRNADQRRILSWYATGDDIKQITAKTGLAHDLVSGTVSTLTSFDRGRARQLVIAYDASRKQSDATLAAAVAASKPPTKAKPSTADTPAKMTMAEPDPVDTPRSQPRTRRPLDELIAEAESSPLPALQRAAARIRKLGADLHDALEASLHEAAVRARIAELKAELDQKHAELRGMIGKPINGAEKPVDWKTIRTWAAQQGMPCPATGRVPRTVVDAYQLVNGGAV
jgi:hypothetical protein